MLKEVPMCRSQVQCLKLSKQKNSNKINQLTHVCIYRAHCLNEINTVSVIKALFILSSPVFLTL